MLVITRKDQQSVIITAPNGDIITIQIINIQPGQVRLGFEAPLHYAIDRKEAVERNMITRRLVMEGKHEF